MYTIMKLKHYHGVSSLFTRKKYYTFCLVFVCLLILYCDFDYYKDRYKKLFVYKKDGEWCPRCSPEVFIESKYFEKVDQVLIDKPSICSQKSLGLILLPSSAKNTLRRDFIRKTWYPIAKKAGFDVVFGVGQAIDKAKLLAEDAIYHDILQWPVDDSWRRLPVKTAAMLLWFDKNCQTKWLIKVDDDSLLNIPLLVQMLNSEERKNVLIGNVIQYMVNCDAWWKDRYCVSLDDQTKLKPYPLYAFGGTYLLHRESVRLLAEKYKQEKNTSNSFYLEDVFMGYLCQKASIKPVNHPGFDYCSQISERDFFTRIYKMISIYDCNPYQLQALWKRISLVSS